MNVTSNIPSLNAYNNLKKNGMSMAKSAARLSSGFRINTTADDAAGLAISEKMRAQIRGLEQAERNVRDGISLVQTSESGLSEITNMIQRQRELIIQGLNDTNTDEDRQKIDEEIRQLTNEIDALAQRTEFNKINLLASDCDVVADRSRHFVNVVTQSMLPPTTTSASEIKWYPAGTAEQPLHETNHQTDVDSVTHNYSHSASTTDIRYADGREGYNEYEKSVHTETKTTSETTISESLTKDSGYTTFELSGEVRDDNLRCRAQKTNPDQTPSNPNVPDIGLPTTRDIDIIIDGTVYDTSDNYTAFTTVTSTATEIVRTAVFDGIELEERFTLNADNSSEITFTLKNVSGTDNRVVDLNLLAVAAGLGFSFTYPSGLNANTYFYDGGIPTSGTLIHYANDYLEYDLSFTGSVGNVNPHRFYSDEFMVGGGTVPRCDLFLEWRANIDDGEEVSFGFKYTNVNFKQEVYLHEEYTETQASAVTITTTTDIKDVYYAIPALHFQVGANANQSIRIPLQSITAKRLGITDVGLLPPAVPEQSLDMLDEALTKVTRARSTYGVLQNRMEYTINSLSVSSENLSDAESRILDTDMAKEMMAYTKSNVLNNAAVVMLTQANQQTQMVLQLLN